MAPEPVSPETARRSTGEGQGLAWQLVDRADLSVVQELIPPGGGVAAHAHDRSRQFFHVLRGECTAVVGGRTILVQEGCGLEVPPRTRHAIRNDSEEDLELLVVSSPRVARTHTHARGGSRERSPLVVGSYLRRTRRSDLQRVADIEAALDTQQWIGEGGLAWHEKVLGDPDMEHWVLVDRLDRVVAFGVLAGVSTPGVVEIRRMVVAPEGRGQGLGRILMRHLLEEALAGSPTTRVWLDVGEDNTRARSLYRTLGFVEKPPPPDAVLLDNGLYMEWSR